MALTEHPTAVAPAPEPGATRNVGLLIIQVYSVLLLVIPPDIGLPGVESLYPAAIVAIAGLTIWLAGTIVGTHDPLRRPNPARLSIAALWLVALTSFVAMQFTGPTADQEAGNQLWFLRLLVWTGVILVAGDSIRTVDELRRAIRPLVWAGAFMGLVTLLQFRLRLDLTETLRQVPGFVRSSESYNAIDARGDQARAAGTALHPIALGASAAALLPLAVANALQPRRDRKRPWVDWVLVALVAVPLVASLSRTALLATAVSFGVLVLCLAPRERVVALLMLPLAVVATFLFAPGAISTMRWFVGAGSADPSIAKRQYQAALVERLSLDHPWFGRGVGTWLPAEQYTNVVYNQILDNQYFGLVLETGFIGVALVALGYLLLPPVLALVARGRATDPWLRLVGGALAAGSLVAVAVSYTFDSFSFPTYAGLQALLVGLIGAYWQVVRDTPPTTGTEHPATATDPSTSSAPRT